MNARAIFPGTEHRGRRERLLQRHLEAAERILAELDALDGEPDLEPSLAGFNPLGSFADREADGGGANSDEEPNLGSLGGTAVSKGSQRPWSGGHGGDLEHEHDGREPVSGDEGAQCEDEGSYRDGDYEPSDSGMALTYPDTHDQRTPWPVCGLNGVDGYATPVEPDDNPSEFIARCEAGLAR